jgi:hypothetical protein
MATRTPKMPSWEHLSAHCSPEHSIANASLWGSPPLGNLASVREGACGSESAIPLLVCQATIRAFLDAADSEEVTRMNGLDAGLEPDSWCIFRLISHFHLAHLLSLSLLLYELFLIRAERLLHTLINSRNPPPTNNSLRVTADSYMSNNAK